jgi:RNase P subunit RPR2
MAILVETHTQAHLVYEARNLANGSQVLLPRIVLPRTCRRLDGVTKISYESRTEAKAARAKYEVVYRCRNCGRHHVATRHRN